MVTGAGHSLQVSDGLDYNLAQSIRSGCYSSATRLKVSVYLAALTAAEVRDFETSRVELWGLYLIGASPEWPVPLPCVKPL